jgi:A/G-specific adenine glycosylase
MKKSFTRKIMHWHLRDNKRIMPWKGEKDPYKIWISEIILQQTRVEQGLSYYNNFIRQFPTLESLALAADEIVYKVWEGLGYYSRCKNLLFTARYIYNDLNGNFPSEYENILKLKGIGPYTAAAISSFAYGLPHAVVDGNVFRLLARYFGEAFPIDSQKGKEHFSQLAQQLLDKKDPAEYNQAVMDFGATVCKPQIAECQHCILQQECVAYNNGLVNKLPVKEKLLVRKKRFFTYFIFLVDQAILVNKRDGKDIWQNLYEFYLYESDKRFDVGQEEIDKIMKEQIGVHDYKVIEISDFYKQQLTHQNLEGRFVRIVLKKMPDALKHFVPINEAEIGAVPFPRFINQYLQSRLALLS